MLKVLVLAIFTVFGCKQSSEISDTKVVVEDEGNSNTSPLQLASCLQDEMKKKFADSNAETEGEGCFTCHGAKGASGQKKLANCMSKCGDFSKGKEKPFVDCVKKNCQGGSKTCAISANVKKQKLLDLCVEKTKPNPLNDNDGGPLDNPPSGDKRLPEPITPPANKKCPAGSSPTSGGGCKLNSNGSGSNNGYGGYGGY